jgi:nucleoside-diphosphate kinase
MEKTFAIIKPDAVGNGHVGKVLARVEEEGFRIVAMRMVRMTRREAEGFYAVHRERPFFDSLTAYMSSGPAVTLVLEREGAIAHWRKTMGATDPAKAEAGTIRKQIGESIERNAVHGSDAPETAAVEIAYFFRGVDQLAER